MKILLIMIIIAVVIIPPIEKLVSLNTRDES